MKKILLLTAFTSFAIHASTSEIGKDQEVDSAAAVGAAAIIMDVRQTAIDELVLSIQENQLVCLQGEHGVGKKHVATKALESIGVIKDAVTLPVNGVLGVFKAALTKLYRETDNTQLHALLIDVTKMLTFPIVGQFDNALRQEVENRKQELECLFQFLQLKEQSADYNLKTLKLVFTSCVDIPDELTETIYVIKLPAYSGREKAILYARHFQKATQQQISEHVLFHAEHPGIQKGPLKKLSREALDECHTPGTVNIVGITVIDGKQTGYGQICQLEALLLPCVDAFNNLKQMTSRHVVPTQYAADAVDDSLHVPHTVLTARFPKRAFGKTPIFKLFADDTKRSGPSGSVSVYLALASSLFKKLIPSTILCSGELGLHGQIRPIGGELIKFREAYRAGITKFLLHPTNCKMITDAVDPSLLAQVELMPVLHVRDAEKAVFGEELKDSEHIDGIETALTLADQVSQHPILLSLFGKNQIPGNTGSATAPSESLMGFREPIEAMLTGQFSENTTESPM